jgi:CrcB protein
MTDRFETLLVPLSVAVGGAIGALMRWGLASAVVGGGFPWATFITNISGSFALGVVLVVGEVVGPHKRYRHKPWVRLWRPFMATGVLGGFTTFSTFALELNRLDVAVAATYLAASVVFGLLAYASGNAVARMAFKVNA